MTTEPEAIPSDVDPAGRPLNEAGWALTTALPGPVPGYIFNAIKPALRVAIQRYLAEAAALDRASRAPVDGAGWRPIETAPKDGTVIDLWFLGSGRRTDCVWGEAISGQHPGNQVWLVDGLERNIVKGIPTHWMTRPAAPGTHPAPASPDAELALKEATALAVSLFSKHYRDDKDYASGRVKWEPLPDLRGVISQIDNMTTGLSRVTLEPAPKPAGGEWVLVPREPTPEMTSKGDCCLPQFSEEADGDDVASEVYRTMVLAAPPAPAASPSGGEVRKLDPHRFAVVSSDYAHPFLLGAYQTMENAVRAQGGKPDTWHIFERYASPEAPQASEVVREIVAERWRQVEAEGWTPEHDDTHINGEMAAAATCYTFTAARSAHHLYNYVWPWSSDWWKPDGKRRNLVKAAALIIAEIERLDRATLAKIGGANHDK